MFETNVDKMVKEYNRKLTKEFGKKGIPLAAAFTLNQMANDSMKDGRKLFERGRVIRNKWSKSGIRFQKTKTTLPIKKMESRSGMIREYGDIQERGGMISADKKFIPIPALGSRISRSKRKRIAKKFNINNLGKIRRLPKMAGSPKRRFAAMLNIARKEKYFGPFLITKKDAGGFKLPVGIFNLSAQGRGRRGGGKITMLRKLKKNIRVPGSPYIAPAGARAGKRMDRKYTKQAKRVLRIYSKDIR